MSEKENKKNKKRIGDRKDGKLIRDIDAMHFIVPMLYPNRCDNEAFINEVIDLTNADEYIKKLNETATVKYNYFHLLIASFLKAITLRPKMNRFIANKNIYQRNERSVSFVVKKSLTDDGEEGLAFIKAEDDDNIFTIHEKIVNEIEKCRKEEMDASSAEMDRFNKMPRWFSKMLVNFICRLDRKGKVPQKLIDTDPYYSSIIFSQLGSIRMHSGYHHLTNWGTNSIFCTVGEKKMRNFYNVKGEGVLKDSVDIGLTIDERIADGLYYARTIKLIIKLMENPALLELPLSQDVKDL